MPITTTPKNQQRAQDAVQAVMEKFFYHHPEQIESKLFEEVLFLSGYLSQVGTVFNAIENLSSIADSVKEGN